MRVPEPSSTSRAPRSIEATVVPSRRSTSCVRVPVRRVHERAVALVAALEVALRQRRPLVRPLGLGAEQDDPAVVPALPQTLDRLRARQPGTHDHDLTSSLPRSRRTRRQRTRSRARSATAGGVANSTPDRRRPPRRMDGRLAPWAHADVAGTPLPPGRHLRRDRDELRPVLGGGRTSRALPDRRRRHRDAGEPDRGRRVRVARVPAGDHPGAALRLPRARSVRPGAGPALQPEQAAARPVRQGDRRPDRRRPVAVLVPSSTPRTSATTTTPRRTR